MVQLIGNAFVYRAGFSVDGDGSPHAYHHDNKKALDYIANAGKPGDWYGIVTNDQGVPVMQNENDPAPGYYVSPTSLADRNFKATDPRRYVNSEEIPYITTTRDMMRSGAKLGDVGIVFYGAMEAEVIVADVGPHPGEGSIKLANTLGIPPSPKNGGISSPMVSYVHFCASAQGWPRDFASIQTQARLLFDKWGGLARLSDVLSNPKV